MISISEDPFNRAGLVWAGNNTHNFNATHVTKAATSLKEATDLTILTSEGDKVTLSYGSEYQAAYVTYDKSARVNENFSGLRAEALGLYASRELGVSVEGDLNAQELKDIKKVLKAIGKILRDFLHGDATRAAITAKRLGSLETLASVQASLQFEQLTYVEQRSSVEAAYSTPEMVTSEASRVDTPGPKQMAEAIERIIRLIKHSGINPRKMVKPIDALFRRVNEELFKGEKNDSPKFAVAKQMRSNLLENLEALYEGANT